MRIRLEKRLTPSRFMLVATPVASVLLTMLLGAVIFELLGFDGPDAIYQTFITPIVAPYKWVDVLTKAAPLIIIALGLSLGNQAKIWNIGAEGQYVIGALAGAGVALRASGRAGLRRHSADARWRGLLGGMVWAGDSGRCSRRASASPRCCRRLMLVYVAMQVLNYLIGGPWKDPNGHNFPQTPPLTAPPRPCRTSFFGTVVPPGLRRRHRADAGLLGAPVPLGLRLLGAHRRRRPERRALRRLRRLAHGVVDADDQRRHGGPCRHPRGDEPARADQPRLSVGLRLHRDHRLLPRPAASDRRFPRGPDPRRHLCRRPGRADRGACARSDRRHLPGDHAVLHSGERHPGALPRCAWCAAAPRSAQPAGAAA